MTDSKFTITIKKIRKICHRKLPHRLKKKQVRKQKGPNLILRENHGLYIQLLFLHFPWKEKY